MKRIIATLACAMISFALSSAQDLAQITDMYNSAAATLSSGDKAGALESFLKVYDLAVALGDEGAEVAANCKDAIPNIGLAVATDLVKESKHDEAIAKLKEAVELANKFGDEATALQAEELLPQVTMQKAGVLLNGKEYAAAAATYKEIVDADPTNGVALLRMGMALNGAGEAEAAKEAFAKASENGQAAQANKQLANLYLREAAALLKEKKYDEAIAAADKCNEYGDNKQAYQIAGQAAQLANKIPAAISYFEKLVELFPNDKNAGQFAYTVGALYQNSKNLEKAKEYYQKAVNDPKYGEQAKKMLDALK